MINFVVQDLLSRGFAAERVISTLERMMQCGVGKCNHCCVGSKYLCRDGRSSVTARSGSCGNERRAPSPPAGLLTALRALLRGRVVIMGIGNPLRGDDAVGSVVAGALRARLQATSPPADSGRVTVLDAEEIPESWLGRRSPPAPT